MAIEDLYDSTFDVYRRSQSAGTVRAPKPGWARVVEGSGFMGRIWDTNESWRTEDGGLAQGGTYRGACGGSVGVLEGDVLSVTAGPHTGKKLLVMGAAGKTAPVSVHHVRLRLRSWHGSLAV